MHARPPRPSGPRPGLPDHREAPSGGQFPERSLDGFCDRRVGGIDVGVGTERLVKIDRLKQLDVASGCTSPLCRAFGASNYGRD